MTGFSARSDDTVKPIGIRRKDPKPELQLVKLGLFEMGGCRHERFLIDERAEKVKCRDCGEPLNPLWVLGVIASKESLAARNFERYQDEMARLKKRTRTKCLHCGKMTPISRR
jgi:hypothetical protein